MSDSAGLRKPLHPFVKFVVIAAALIVALDLATAMLSYSKALSNAFQEARTDGMTCSPA